MSKFALLAIFLALSISWLYHPIDIDPNDAMIDKYRPSINQSPHTVPLDSILPVKTNYASVAQALHFPNVAFAVRYDSEQ